MKKLSLFSLLLAVILSLCVAFAGCGNNDNEIPDDSDVSTGATVTYYTVTFDSQGGSAVESQRIAWGNPISAPESPTRGDDIFKGWYKSTDDDAELWNFATDRVNDNITLYAFWQVDISEPTDSITYELNTDRTGYIVTGSGQESKIVIPEKHEDLPVVEIGDRAFAYSRHTSDILSVTIPDSVTKIGLNAFHNQDALVSVNIGTNSKLQSIGNNAFSGNSSLTSIYLPAGFNVLGNDVYNNCGSLNTITVASGNTVYSSEGNNLIEIETHKLIRGSNSSKIPSSVTEIAPSAFRRANGISSLDIPVSITKIGNYFIADSTITTIRYEGTEEQWNAIDKSATMWNYGNREVVIEYNTTETELKILVAYFSRADENYSVGYIEKGNTEIIAEIIAEEVGGDLFHIERNTPYPAGYEDCKTVATAEKNSNARPALKEDKDISEYDVIFIGYPIWWGDAPMPVYSFAENKDWTGKTVIPFSTHEGSGLGSGESNLKKICIGADFKTGLAIRGATAQNSTATAKTQVKSWLDSLGF